jgi:hypothetical protein
MSLINDALKQARKAPPRNLPSAVPPLQPVADDDGPSPLAWLAPAVVILLIVGAIFFIAWAVAHHSVKSGANAPETVAGIKQESATTLPVVQPPPADPLPVVNPPEAPKLQAIFYVPSKPSAIIDGKSVNPGDTVGIYRVKIINKSTVILVGPDKKEIQIGVN